MIYLFSLIGPFFLLLVEKVLPYPYLVEEVYKFFLTKSTNSTKVAIALGFLFSLSEAIFYLLNPNYSLFNVNYFLLRLLAVTPLHISTILIMQYMNKKSLSWLGLILAVAIHYLFNSLSTFWGSTKASFWSKTTFTLFSPLSISTATFPESTISKTASSVSFW